MDYKWESRGYDTQKPCDICGRVEPDSNKVDPRYSYTTCKLHADLSPVEFSRLTKERGNNGKV